MEPTIEYIKKTQITATKTPQVALYVWIGKVYNIKPGTEQYL